MYKQPKAFYQTSIHLTEIQTMEKQWIEDDVTDIKTKWII
jgi:hypothetical protein